MILIICSGYVALNTELVNAEPLLLREIQGYVPVSFWLHFIKSVHDVCFCLKTPYLLNIVNSLILNMNNSSILNTEYVASDTV